MEFARGVGKIRRARTAPRARPILAMRIALVHIRHAQVGGTERFLNELAAHLAERGHEVVVVCRRHEAAPHPDVAFERLHALALGGSWRMWSFAREVERHVARADYDLVFGLGKTYTHDVVRSGGGCHQTYLDDAHEYTKRGIERALLSDALRNRVHLSIEARAYAPESSRRIVVNSVRTMRDIQARYGPPDEQFRVIRNGVDVETFHPRNRAGDGAALRRELGYSDDDRVVLFLGRGFGRKGLDRLLRAMPAAIAAHPGAKLLVVGRDEAVGRYRRLADELRVADRVQFRPESRAPAASFAAADLYVLPTRFDPFPHTVLEALATGLPVITTERAGASEILDPGVQGSVVAAAGPDEELAEAVVHWLDPDRARATEPAARALAEQYPFSRTLEETTRLLEEHARC